MKTLFFILTLIPVLAYADTANNQAINRCLKQQGYSIQNFDNFSFEKAAKCHLKTVSDTADKENAELTVFLKENPHYKGDGSGWYKSVEIYGTR